MIDSVGAKLMYIRFWVFLAVLFGGTHSLAADVLYSVTDLGSLGGSYRRSTFTEFVGVRRRRGTPADRGDLRETPPF